LPTPGLDQLEMPEFNLSVRLLAQD
jgi:hypothetical protein